MISNTNLEQYTNMSRTQSNQGFVTPLKNSIHLSEDLND